MEPPANALIAFDSKTYLLHLLQLSDPPTLHIHNIQSQTFHSKVKLPQILFPPLQIIPNGDYISILGKNSLFVMCIRTPEHGKQIGWGQEVRCVKWHPLCQSCLVVLNGDDTLRVYNIDSSVTQSQTYLVKPRNSRSLPVNFQFLGESNLNLSRFACLILMNTGQIYQLSPILPTNFITYDDLLLFENIVKLEKNFYRASQPKLQDWLDQLLRFQKSSQFGSNRVSFAVDRYFIQKFSPQLVGPLNQVHKGFYQKIHVVRSANPTVLVLQNGCKLIVQVSFGDLVPVFSSQKRIAPCFKTFEQIQLDSEGKICIGDKFYVVTSSAIYSISIPWMDQLVSIFKNRNQKTITQQSSVKQIGKYTQVVDFTLVQHKLDYNFLLVSRFQSTFKLDLFNIQQEQDFFPVFQNLQVEKPKQQTLQPLVVPNPPKIQLQISGVQDDFQELAEMTKAIDQLVVGYADPLNQKIAFIKKRIEDLSAAHLKLFTSISNFTPQSILALENSVQAIKVKFEETHRNSVIIDKRISSIKEKLANYKRPLNSAQQELAKNLFFYQKRANSMKMNAQAQQNEISAYKKRMSEIQVEIPFDQRLVREISKTKRKIVELSDSINAITNFQIQNSQFLQPKFFS